MALKILFIGGTGQISYPCVERAVAAGHQVSVFNRGLRGDPLPAGVASIVGELGSPAYADLAKANYDQAVEWGWQDRDWSAIGDIPLKKAGL